MTRINLVDPKLLTDNHLMAEYRELPMIAGSLKRSLRSKKGIPAIPNQYVLGSGHVTSFYNKGQFLFERYQLLVNELRSRNYQLDSSRVVDFDVFKKHGLYHTWSPSNNDINTNIARIKEKLNMKPNWYRFWGTKLIDLDHDTFNRICFKEQK